MRERRLDRVAPPASFQPVRRAGRQPPHPAARTLSTDASPARHLRPHLFLALVIFSLLAAGAGCGPKPQAARPDPASSRRTPAEPGRTEAPATDREDRAGAAEAPVEGTHRSAGGAGPAESERASSTAAILPPAESTESALDAASVEELLTAAEAALGFAGEALADGDVTGYRAGWSEALAALRRAESKLIEDPGSFPALRPAYEKLLADLREGLAPPAEAVEELGASAEELAHAEEVHPPNGRNYEMPIDPHNPLVAKYLALFQEGRRREAVEEAFARAGRYRSQILSEIRARGLPEELWVVPVIESGYKVNAYSRARAVGLWQFMASTARHYGLVVNEWIDERRDPIKSTRAALDYLKDLYEWFNSWDFALAAYNRGEGGIHRDIERSRIADFMEMAELGATHRETQNHVPQIHAAAIIAKNPKQYGFELKDEPITIDTVLIDYVVDLEVAARCAGTTEDELRELNPELRTWVTPVLSSTYPSYALKLPPGSAERYLAEIAKVDDKTPKRQVVYVVRRGDTLGSIARKFGVSLTSIRRWNHLRSNRIRPGQRLVVMGQRARNRTRTVEREAATTGGLGTLAGEPGGSGRSATVALHTVRRGDTLYAIAKLYNTTVDNLRRLNGLGRSGRIYPGQRLRVPDAGQPDG